MKDLPSGSTKPEIDVDIVIESQAWRTLPEAEDTVRRAIAFAATSKVEIPHRKAEISVLLCDDETIADLNARWRGRKNATNVLSFPAPLLQGAAPHDKMPLGDIAIAYETLAREAEENATSASDHLSHLVVHGFLHLLGYDHHMDDEAERMERLERDILARIGVADPYAACDADI